VHCGTAEKTMNVTVGQASVVSADLNVDSELDVQLEAFLGAVCTEAFPVCAKGYDAEAPWAETNRHKNALSLAIKSLLEGRVIRRAEDRISSVLQGSCLSSIDVGRPVNSAVWHPHQAILAVGSSDNGVRATYASNGSTAQVMQGHTSFIHAVAYSPDGGFLASASADSTAKIWNAATGALVRTLTGDLIQHTAPVLALAYSPQGAHIATGAQDSTIKIWDAATGACAQTLNIYSDKILSLAFSPDGRHLSSGGSDHRIRVWDTGMWSNTRTMVHDGVVNSVTYSPDGSRLASGSDDTTLRIWDPADGACTRTLYGHKLAINAVAYSPDGRHVASGSDDLTVKIWDTNTGACVATLTGHTLPINSVMYSRDGTQLVSGSDDGIIRIVNLLKLTGSPNGSLTGSLAGSTFRT